MSSDDIVIDVSNLGKRYEVYSSPRDRLKQLVLPPLYRGLNRVSKVFSRGSKHQDRQYFREFWALKNVSFQVRPGETIGIIGRNGGGKSTLLQILAGTLSPTEGTVHVNGRVAALLELGSGFDPEFTGRENVFLNGRILGLTQKEIEARYDQIVEFADIGDFIDQPVKTYSSGMFVRLAFAVQAHIDASIVIIDEALAVGDVFFRQKCYARLEKLRKSGAAVLLVSHAMSDIEQFCERAILLDHGQQKFLGPAVEAARHYYLMSQSNQSISASVFEELSESKSCEEISEGLCELPISIPKNFIDISKASQIGNGKARCVAIALCDQFGKPCNVFRQGDIAVFHSEFEVFEDIDAPICGVAIANDKGVLVHGKNSWQYDEAISLSLKKGKKLICQHEVQLNLGLGDFTFEIGLTCVPIKDWKRRKHISHDEFASLEERICHVTAISVFSVRFASKNGTAVLTHHGVADLPGKISMIMAPVVEGDCVKHPIS